MIGFCFFCGLALAAPDRSLLASNAKVTLPFANSNISFVNFLVIAPVVLTAISLYLHIFVGYWINLSRQQLTFAASEKAPPLLPFVFNLQYRTATWLSDFLFYWLVPIVLAIFAWKALPRPEAPALIVLTGAFLAVFLFLQIRRRRNHASKIYSFVLWPALLGSIVLTFMWAGPLRQLRLYKRTLTWERPRRQLDLYKADLREQDLGGVDLYTADLRGASLGDANLDSANLALARLNGAHLNRAYMYDAILILANLSGAHLECSHLNNADIARANMEGAHLNGADLNGASLYFADLRGAHLDGANMVGARWTGADLTGANLSGAHLRLTDVGDAKGLTRQQIDSAIKDQGNNLSAEIGQPASCAKGTP